MKRKNRNCCSLIVMIGLALFWCWLAVNFAAFFI
jgi:hypothetical protein